MSKEVDDYLAHHGLAVDDEIKHYGKKGMKWGVRKDRTSSGEGESRWTDDQKRKAKTIGTIALIAAVSVGAIYAKSMVRADNDLWDALDAPKTISSGKKIAEDVLKAKGSMKVPSMAPELKKFLADTPARMLADQKGWSETLGQSLNNIQKGDAQFIADYIKNYGPKALGA